MNAGSSDESQFVALESSVKGVLVLQIIATILVLAAVFVYSSTVNDGDVMPARFKAALYGAALALLSTLLSARSMRRTGGVAPPDVDVPVQFSIAPVFAGLLNKLLIVGGGIGFGLIIGLHPILLVFAYLTVQLAAATQLLKPG